VVGHAPGELDNASLPDWPLSIVNNRLQKTKATANSAPKIADYPKS
jgi:hypothetical protein